MAAILLLASSTNINVNIEPSHDTLNARVDEEQADLELEENNLADSTTADDLNSSIKDFNNISFSGIDFESILHKGIMIFKF